MKSRLANGAAAVTGFFRHRLRTLRWLAVVAILLAAGGFILIRITPIPPALLTPLAPGLEFADCHGTPLRAVRSPDRAYQRPAAYREIPSTLINATLAAEDGRFWIHPGVDWRSSLRAAWSLIRHRRIVSGGSTITQQLIKLAQPRPRTWRTKLAEALAALRLEQTWDKERILVEYLNRLEYGNLNTGCAKAAEYYFGKPLADLSTAECALLAGLPQAPSRLNPLRHWERACRRQQWILQRMRTLGFLRIDQFERARQERLSLATPRRAFQAPHFVDCLWPRLDLNPRPEPDGAPGPTALSGVVRTTLDLELNRQVEGVLRRQIDQLRRQHVRDGAAVVIDNRTGGILALVGSEDYFSMDSGQVNGALAPRSAGSTLKPFTYLIAFEQGATPASIVADVPTEFSTATGLFTPVNYDRRCRGPVRYRLALANSLNIGAVKVLASIGGAAVLQARLQECGVTTLSSPPEHYGLGLTIGNAEVRLLELANVYATLARLGEFRPCTFFARNADDGARSGPGRRVFEATAAYLVADILQDNAARAACFGAETSLRFDFPVACKTGTSSDFRDNWAFGFTPEFTVGVWVGNFDGSPMEGVSGVTGAAPILHEVVEYLHRRHGTTWYSKPDSIVERAIHPFTGKSQANPVIDTRVTWVQELFPSDRCPAPESRDDYSPFGLIRLAAEYRDWFDSGDNCLAGRAVVDGSDSALKITFPPPGTTFLLNSDLPGQGRRIELRAQGSGPLVWRSDTLTCREEQGRMMAILEAGRHRLSVRDAEAGSVRDTWIEVRER